MQIALIYIVLINSGIPVEDAAKMMCIAHRESHYKTTAINSHNPDGTRDYGLFQINDRWVRQCAGGKPMKLLKEQVNIGCAVYIYNEQGLEAWATYKYCK